MKLTAAQQTNLKTIATLGPLVRRNFTWYRASDSASAQPVRGLNMTAINSLQRLGLVAPGETGFGVTPAGERLAKSL